MNRIFKRISVIALAAVLALSPPPSLTIKASASVSPSFTDIGSVGPCSINTTVNGNTVTIVADWSDTYYPRSIVVSSPSYSEPSFSVTGITSTQYTTSVNTTTHITTLTLNIPVGSTATVSYYRNPVTWVTGSSIHEGSDGLGEGYVYVDRYLQLDETYIGSWTGTATTMSAPSISISNSNSTTSYPSVSWGSVTGATGYTIEYSTDSSFSSKKTIMVS